MSRAARVRGLRQGPARLVGANGRVLELQEAIAVAANRYGNAVSQGARPVQALHQATMRALSALLADASKRRDAASATFARAIRDLGIRRLTVGRGDMAKALRRQAGRPALPRGLISRLLRRHLIADAKDAASLLRQGTPRRASRIDVLRVLQTRVDTRQMRGAAQRLTLGDVARLAEGLGQGAATPPGLATRSRWPCAATADRRPR